MSGIREFRMSVSNEMETEIKEFLVFSRWELPHVYDSGDEGEVGLNIHFCQDIEDAYDDNVGCFEIH